MTFLNEYWLAGAGNPILRQLNYYKTQKPPPQYKLGGGERLEIRNKIQEINNTKFYTDSSAAGAAALSCDFLVFFFF